MEILVLIIKLLVLASILAFPFVYIIRIKTNVELSKKKIEDWAKKMKFTVNSMKLKKSSLFFNNFGRYQKKQYYSNLSIDKNTSINVIITCRFSIDKFDYENIVYNEL